MNWKTTVILAALVAILGGYTYVDSQREPVETWDENRVFGGFDSDSVTRLEVSQAGAAATVMAKSGDGHWGIEKPTAWPANESVVKAIINMMEYLAAVRTVSGEDLAKFEFGDVAVSVKLVHGDDETPLAYEVGDSTDNGKRRYLRVSGRDDAVYVVDAAEFEKLNKSEADLRAVDLFRLLTADLTGVAVVPLGGPDSAPLSFQKRDDFWHLVDGAGVGYADGVAVESLADTCRAIKVTSFVDQPVDGDDPYGLGTPARRMTLAAGEELSETLLIGSPVADQEGQFHAQLDGYEPVFVVNLAVFSAALKADVDSYVSPSVLVLRNGDVQDLEVALAGGETVALVRSGIDWLITAPVQQPADAGGASDLIAALRGLKVEADAVAVSDELEPFGLATPWARVTVRQQGLERRLLIGKESGEGRRFVKRDEESAVLEATVAALDDLARDGWISLRRKQVFTWTRWDVQKLAVAQAEGEAVTIEKKEHKWQLGDEPVDEDKVNALLDALAGLSAQSFRPDVTPAAAGLEPPVRTITVTTKKTLWDAPKDADGKAPEEFEDHVLHLGKAASDAGGVFASAPGVESVFVVAAEVADAAAVDLGRRDKVFAFGQWDVESVVLQVPGGPAARYEKQEYKWQPGEGAAPLDEDVIKALVEDLSGILATQRRPGLDLAASGLDPALLAVTISVRLPDAEEGAAPTDHVLRVGQETEAGRFALVEGFEEPFVLDTLVADLLWSALPPPPADKEPEDSQGSSEQEDEDSQGSSKQEDEPSQDEAGASSEEEKGDG